MTHPYSIFIWKPPLSHYGKGSWIEAFQAYNEDFALYAANLIHIDSKAVIKVVQYRLNLACFPDEHAVELVERQIARQQEEIYLSRRLVFIISTSFLERPERTQRSF